MATPLLDSDDVETALMRALTTTETTYINGLCEQVSTLLRSRMSTIDDRIALPATDPRYIDPLAVSAMLAQVVKRYLANVDGATSLSQATGPFSTTKTFVSYGRDLGADGDLRITDDDISKLTGAPVPVGATIRTRLRHGCVPR